MRLSAVQRRARVRARSADDSRALALYQSGATYRQIASHLGFSESTARRVVERALDQVTADWRADLQLELLRLDALLQPFWQPALGTAAIDGAPAIPPSLAAVDAVLRIMDRQARLLGLYSKRAAPELPKTLPEESDQSIDIGWLEFELTRFATLPTTRRERDSSGDAAKDAPTQGLSLLARQKHHAIQTVREAEQAS